jgi:hypothetical protein
MEDTRVYYTYNADSDPTNLDKRGYFLKYKDELERESGIIYKERTSIYHVPQYDLTNFLDRECRRRLTFEKDKSGYYCIYSIKLNELQSKAKDSVFLTILLEAYKNNHLAEQIEEYYFCNKLPISSII